MDSLNDLPGESRQEVVAAVQAALGVSEEAAAAIVRASEPLWDAMEEVGSLVDSWGGGEFCDLFPRMCAVIRS
jgi:hypothetical protein